MAATHRRTVLSDNGAYCLSRRSFGKWLLVNGGATTMPYFVAAIQAWDGATITW